MKKYIGDCKMKECAVACCVSDYWLVVWNPLSLAPSDGVFGRSDLAALLRLPHLSIWLSVNGSGPICIR